MTRVTLNPRRGRDLDKPLIASDDEENAHPWLRRLHRYVWSRRSPSWRGSSSGL